MVESILFETIITVAGVFLTIAVGCLVIYFVSKILRIHPNIVRIDHPVREMRLALIVLLVTSIITIIINVLIEYFARPFLISIDLQSGLHNLISLYIMGILYFVFLLPMLYAMRYSNQPIASIGISRTNTKKMIELGIVLGVLFSLTYTVLAISTAANTIDATLSYMVATYVQGTIASSSFIILIMGYIQTRIAAYANTLTGVTAAALLYTPFKFSLSLPTIFLINSLGPSEIIYGLLAGFMWGMFLSYMKRKGGSIIPPLIFMAITECIFVVFLI